MIKKKMENAVIDGLIPYDRDAALDYIKKLYQEQFQ
jgi:poly(A) polymerase